MLTMEERKKFQKLLEMISEDDQKGPDVSNRLRDPEGRFLPNPSESQEEESHLRSIRLVKVRGSYGTYLVKDWDSVIRAIGVFCTVGAVILMTYLF